VLNAQGLTAVRDTVPGGMIRVTARMPQGRLDEGRGPDPMAATT
jgi:hypothetical protein